MQYVHVKKIPEILKIKERTEKEASEILWSEIYQNPGLYGLDHMDEDEKSEFLIDLHTKFPQYIENFRIDEIDFITFLRSCIKIRKIGWKKKWKMEHMETSCMTKYLTDKTEEELRNNQNYEPEENSNSISTFSSETKQRISNISMIVLALKACKDIDDELICKICDYTGFDKDFLYEKIQEVKESMSERDKKREQLITRRNNAFYFHRRYAFEMKAKGKEDLSYNNLHERYQHQTENWIKRNKLLSKKFKNSPSNNTVAKILGLKPRSIGFYISNAERFKPEQEETKKETEDAEDDSESHQKENQEMQ
ncbi:MAG: hypothetical protein KBT11_05280 [Treponema sp.]|nr:hypothetical protein [Candidatus Treponema equifaecale]